MLLPLVFALGLAQSQDLTLSLGSHLGQDYKSGMFLGANYAHRIKTNTNLTLSGVVDFVASPNRKADFINPLGSRDVASLFAMPGLRLSFKPDSRLSPFVTGGLGLAVYEQSQLLQNGAPFPGSRVTNHFGGMFGGGVDLKAYRFAGLRFEAKDYYSQRHNILLGIGLHFRFGAK
jgi:opacity protein-like surface antigen